MRQAYWKGLTLLFLTVALSADTLKLRDGKSIEGKILLMNEQGVRFETTAGEVRFFKDNEIVSIQKEAAAPLAAAPVPVAATPKGSVIIPQGTVLTVQFDADVTSKHRRGHKFTATLETNIVVNHQVAVPAGTKVYGVVTDSRQQGLVGQSAIAIMLTGFNIGGNIVPIKTEVLSGAGDRKVRQGARGAAAGSAIGAAAGGGSGAATGAMVGAAASTLRRQTVGVAAGTLQDFHLEEAVTIQR